MKKNPLRKSFGFAIEGIINTIRHERNMQIHCFMAACVIVAGILFNISLTEWFVCFMLFAHVMSLELVNTAMEAAVDLVTEEKRPLAKKAKDAAAGAVLIAAIFAAMIGLMIFVPKLFVFLQVFGVI